MYINTPLKMVSEEIESTWENENKSCEKRKFGFFLNQFPATTKKLIRQLERIKMKINRQNMSILFNNICINENLLP